MAIQEIEIRPKDTDRTPIIYRFEDITLEEAISITKKALVDPIAETGEINKEENSTDYLEIGYKEGVTDPREHNILKATNLLGISPLAISTSKLVPRNDANPSQIEKIIFEKPQTLLSEGASSAFQIIPIVNILESELEKLSQERSLFLNVDEMKVIQEYYKSIGRDPTDVELETFAQTWSEHCNHKTFKSDLVDEEGHLYEPLFTRIKETSKKFFEKVHVKTAFSDNSGGIEFYDGYVIIGKGETHNSPVAIEPYAGALTKNGGLYRDIVGTGKGGVNIMSIVVNNFAPPYENKLSDNGVLNPMKLLLENSKGEVEYGNPMGIPTHGVNLHFHSDFGPKPTSMGISIGLIPEKFVEKETPHIGDLIVTVGGKTGRDGVHGATFSSGAMNSETQTTHATAVQLGDPIVEKAAFDAIIACRDAGLVRSLTDCGAGGYSSAIGEIANGIGAVVHLDRVPQKYLGLSSWETWLSESQERMVVAVSPGDWDLFEKICQQFEANATVVGHFSGNNTLLLFEKNTLVGEMELDFLHSGLPRRKMKFKNLPFFERNEVPEFPLNMENCLKNVLSHLNVCSKEKMHRHYDQTVQAMTVLAPFTGVNQDIPSDGSVLAPFPDKAYGVVTSHALNPALTKIDPYWGSVWSFASAATKFTSIGGDLDNACGVDNYVSPFPDEEALYNLNQMTNGLCDMIDALCVPMVSGKDSLSSTYNGPDGLVIKAPPSLNVTIFGKIPDIEKTVSADFKCIGSTICLVGKMDINAMGGSIYFETEKVVNNNVPKADTLNLKNTLDCVRDAIDTGKVLSAKSIGEGGLATVLSQMCFGGECGAEIEVANLSAKRPDFAIFNETAGCLVVEVETREDAYDLFGSIQFEVLGQTTSEDNLKIKHNNQAFLDSNLLDLKKVWQAPMKQILND